MNLDEIQLSKGVGDFRFGTTKSAVIAALGNEFEESIDEDGDIEVAYKSLALRFTFWKNFDFRLGVISTERSSATINEDNLIGKSLEYLREFISNTLLSKISEESGCIHEDGHRLEWLEVDEKSVTFWFRDNKLYLIETLCEWADDNTPAWTNFEA